MAVAGVTQRCSWISLPSTATTPVGAAARKNHVANRFGAIGGGVQWANGTSSDGSTTRLASSMVSRTAARRAPASSPPSSGSTRPPGKTHMPPNMPRELRRSINVSSPASPSRISTTVAAGIGGGRSASAKEDLGHVVQLLAHELELAGGLRQGHANDLTTPQ